MFTDLCHNVCFSSDIVLSV